MAFVHIRQVARTQHRMPAFSKKLEDDLNSGRYILGGCVTTWNDPKWRCLDCETEWGQGILRKAELTDDED
jgi:hypothetical protein